MLENHLWGNIFTAAACSFTDLAQQTYSRHILLQSFTKNSSQWDQTDLSFLISNKLLKAWGPWDRLGLLAEPHDFSGLGKGKNKLNQRMKRGGHLEVCIMWQTAKSSNVCHGHNNKKQMATKKSNTRNPCPNRGGLERTSVLTIIPKASQSTEDGAALPSAFCQDSDFTIKVSMSFLPSHFYHNSNLNLGRRAAKDSIALLCELSKEPGFSKAAVNELCLSGFWKGQKPAFSSTGSLPLGRHRPQSSSSKRCSGKRRVSQSKALWRPHHAGCILRSLLALQPFDTNTSWCWKLTAGFGDAHNHREKRIIIFLRLSLCF